MLDIVEPVRRVPQPAAVGEPRRGYRCVTDAPGSPRPTLVGLAMTVEDRAAAPEQSSEDAADTALSWARVRETGRRVTLRFTRPTRWIPGGHTTTSLAAIFLRALPLPGESRKSNSSV